MIRHFTATVYVFHEGMVLLHPHPKHQKWMPPGGHVEKNETPPEAAKREVEEETGLKITFIKDEKIWVKASYAQSFERPFLCLLEDIPARKGEEAHQHMDLIYLAEPIGDSEKILDPFQWLTLEEVRKIPKEHIFHDTLQVVEQVLCLKNS